jgi:hypothetical protein
MRPVTDYEATFGPPGAVEAPTLTLPVRGSTPCEAQNAAWTAFEPVRAGDPSMASWVLLRLEPR